MTNQLTISKTLGCIEDILFGFGTQVQNRGGTNFTLNKVDKIHIVDDLADLKLLDSDIYRTCYVLGETDIGVGFTNQYFWLANKGSLVYDTPLIVQKTGDSVGAWVADNFQIFAGDTEVRVLTVADAGGSSSGWPAVTGFIATDYTDGLVFGGTIRELYFSDGTNWNPFIWQEGDNVGGSRIASILMSCDAGGEKPVLAMNQEDDDEPFINYVGTSAADSTKSISSSSGTASSKVGAIKMEVNGITKWLRLYDSAV